MMLFTFNTVASLFRRPAPRAIVPDAVDFGFLADRQPSQQRTVEAAYDAAQTVNDNRRYWRWADLLSAKAANSHSVRQIIRSRARHEHDNNPVLKGIITTLANDTRRLHMPRAHLPPVRKQPEEVIQIHCDQFVVRS